MFFRCDDSCCIPVNTAASLIVMFCQGDPSCVALGDVVFVLFETPLEIPALTCIWHILIPAQVTPGKLCTPEDSLREHALSRHVGYLNNIAFENSCKSLAGSCCIRNCCILCHFFLIRCFPAVLGCIALLGPEQLLRVTIQWKVLFHYLQFLCGFRMAGADMVECLGIGCCNKRLLLSNRMRRVEVEMLFRVRWLSVQAFS